MRGAERVGEPGEPGELGELGASSWTRPARLSPGDTIAFVAPAGDLIEDRMLLARERLEARGYRVVVPEGLFGRYGYLSAPDERRAAQLMAAFMDPEVDAVFPGTGGYGVTRMLRLLDFEQIAANPKVFIGFSDITALHLALNRHAGLVTFHAPNPQWGLGSEEGMQPDAERVFWAMLEGEWGDDPGTGTGAGTGNDSGGGAFVYPAVADHPARTVVPGRVRAPVIGGNLSLLAATMGTPWEVDTRGKILIMEDVREAPYRIDRFFAQLRDAGKFDEAAGIVVGQFTKCDPDDPKESFTVDQLIDQYFRGLDKPVIANFPFGHVRGNLTVPFGVPVELDAHARTLRVPEPPTVAR